MRQSCLHSKPSAKKNIHSAQLETPWFPLAICVSRANDKRAFILKMSCRVCVCGLFFACLSKSSEMNFVCAIVYLCVCLWVCADGSCYWATSADRSQPFHGVGDWTNTHTHWYLHWYDVFILSLSSSSSTPSPRHWNLFSQLRLEFYTIGHTEKRYEIFCMAFHTNISRFYSHRAILIRNIYYLFKCTHSYDQIHLHIFHEWLIPRNSGAEYFFW